MYELSIILRSSDDERVFDLYNSIDYPAEIIFTITPNKKIQEQIENLNHKFVITPKGNSSNTLLQGINIASNSNILIIDSDCIFLSGTIKRMLDILNETNADIVKPNILFESKDFSSYLTKIERNFQYTFFNYVYGPGLLINRNKILPKVGNHLFNPKSPFTDDGELDFRIRNSNFEFKIISDTDISIIHKELSFRNHLKSYWRYGYSEASRMIYLQQKVISFFISTLFIRYYKAIFKYPSLTIFTALISDMIYILSIFINYILIKVNYNEKYI
jgi:hypothetical protein